MKNEKVEMNCCCRFDIEELQRLSPQQLKAFMGGIGLVIAAHNAVVVADPSHSRPTKSTTDVG